MTMTSEMDIKAVRVREGEGYAIKVTGVTHATSTTSAVKDGAVWLKGNRAGRAEFVIVGEAGKWDAGKWVAFPGTASVEGTRVSEADARRVASKRTGGRVIPVVEK